MKVVIKMKTKKLELSPEEAKELYNELKKLFEPKITWTTYNTENIFALDRED